MVGVDGDLPDDGARALEEDAALVLFARERLRRIVVGVLAVHQRRRRLEAEMERHAIADLRPLPRTVDAGIAGRVRCARRRAGAARPLERGGADVEDRAPVGDHLRVVGQAGGVEVDVHRARGRRDHVEAERVRRRAAGVEGRAVARRIVLVRERGDRDRLLAGAALPGQVARIAVREIDRPGAGDLRHRWLGAGLIAGADIRTFGERDVVDGDEEAREVDVPPVDERGIAGVGGRKRVASQRQHLAGGGEQDPARTRVGRRRERGQRRGATIGRCTRVGGRVRSRRSWCWRR